MLTSLCKYFYCIVALKNSLCKKICPIYFPTQNKRRPRILLLNRLLFIHTLFPSAHPRHHNQKPEKWLSAIHQRKTFRQQCQHCCALCPITSNHISYNPIYKHRRWNDTIRKPDIKKTRMNLIHMKYVKHARTQQLFKPIIWNKPLKKALSCPI